MPQVKILYVEDEPFLAKIVKESLESRDFKVIWIEDGKEAIPAFERHQPDICVLDVMLPHVDGFQIGTGIRRLSPKIPIIFLTAKNQTQDVLKGFESGGNDYLRKPFSMEELIVRVQNLLQLAGAQFPEESGTDTIPFGRFRFLPQRLELHIGEKVRKLSHRESQLLQILVKNRNAAVDRREILQAVWGDDSFFNSRNLDVYIAKLRDLLKDDPDVQIITLKGVGYHFMVG